MYNDIILFIKIIKIGGFTKAAKTLGITLSTVTRRIHRLEMELGTTLINRNTRFFNLSAFGEQVYNIFCDYETEFENKITALKQNGTEVGGELNIAIPPCFTSSVLAPHLLSFLSCNPELKININTTYHNADLLHDNLDLAIVSKRPTQPSQKIKLLHKSKMILYCSKSYAQQEKLPTTIEELQKKLILGIKSPDSPPSKFLMLTNIHTGNNFRVELKNRIVQTLSNSIDPLVMGGEIIAIGLEMVTKPYLENGDIIQVMPDYFIDGFEYYLLIPNGKIPPRTRLFIDFINTCILPFKQDLHTTAICA